MSPRLVRCRRARRGPPRSSTSTSRAAAPVRPAVDLRLSAGFRRSVLEPLFDGVGFGETGHLRRARALAGSPRAFRAVGSAMATNPIPIVVPCHRVLRSGGALGGYGGGLPAKVRLLELEQGDQALF